MKKLSSSGKCYVFEKKYTISYYQWNPIISEILIDIVSLTLKSSKL